MLSYVLHMEVKPAEPSHRGVVDETHSSMLTCLHDLNLKPSLICDLSSCVVIKSSFCNRSQSPTPKSHPFFQAARSGCSFTVVCLSLYSFLPVPLISMNYITVCVSSAVLGAQYTLVCLHAAVTDK